MKNFAGMSQVNLNKMKESNEARAKRMELCLYTWHGNHSRCVYCLFHFCPSSSVGLSEGKGDPVFSLFLAGDERDLGGEARLQCAARAQTS